MSAIGRNHANLIRFATLRQLCYRRIMRDNFLIFGRFQCLTINI